MKNIGKKSLTLLLIATMLIALIPIVPVNAAIEYTAVVNDTHSNHIDEGYYNDLIKVTGTGVTAGETVKLGWDGLQAWNGVKGVLNSTTAAGSGAWEIWFNVPEAKAGSHYLWVKDMDTGDTLKYDNAFTVLPTLKFSPSSGLINDRITLYGYGYASSSDITTITFADDYGPWPLITTPTAPESDSVGSWSCTFKVPHSSYGDWAVTASDGTNSNASLFTIGPSITLSKASGPVGTIIEITGRGFTLNEDLDSTEVKIDSTICYITDDDTVGTDGKFSIDCVIPQVSDDGDYTITVTENDAGSYSATADFEVTALAKIELEPEFGVQGSSIYVEGEHFTAISGKTVEIWLYNEDGVTPVAKISDKLKTTSSGTFSGTVTIPAQSSGRYTIQAIQSTYYIDDGASFRIGLMIVIPTPTSGPTGTKITLTGTGFTNNENWNMTFGDIAIVEGSDGLVDSDSDLLLNEDVPTFYVPTVPVGTYTIAVYDIDSDITVEVDWTVTATTKVSFDPVNAPNGYYVNVTGSYFNAQEDGDLEFVLYNVTSDGDVDGEWDITVQYEGDTSVLDDEGNFTGWWLVPDSDVLSVGDYILNVTASDASHIMGQGYFSVVAKSIDVEPRKSSFARGETVAFNIWSSFPQGNSYIEIYDPTGDLYWTTDEFESTMWLKVGTLQTVPYYYQTAGGNALLLLEDATLGTWSWEWYDVDDEELSSGTFTVTAAPADVISSQLTQLNADLAQLSTDFSSVSTDVNSLTTSVAALSDTLAQTIAAVNANSNAVQDVAAAVASVADTASNAVDAANAAAAAATSA
ncbi:MAG: IPT/TIG domain-containing protein, partial [Proteobacteria bacterium]|nr:IPT/TIG domain-containing protein [Pseudomonadota bacterium]